MLIETAPTPNPNALKFLPGQAVSPKRAWNFANAAATKGVSPLADRLFQVDGVAGVMLGGDFISVTKRDALPWDVVRPAVLGVLLDHYIAGQAVLTPQAANAKAPVSGQAARSPEEQRIVDQINELLETRVRPAVARDGGDITFKGFDFDRGVLTVDMFGACESCPSATATLKQGVERMMQHYIPEVFTVELAPRP